MTLLRTVSGLGLEAGCDEAGRGCLAGPVTAAAVILPADFHHPWLNDSKQLSQKKREVLRPIIEQEALAWAVAECSPAEIDKLNILWASIEAMHRALAQLKLAPEFIAVDGNRFKPFGQIPFKTEVKGDGRFLNIAAASILAKTHRDERMFIGHASFPHYRWDKNMGYPTAEHRQAIREQGPCEWHRKSFQLLPLQQTLF
ncbi:MAG: ribonuclease HII [Bacteroidetes bacterium]|nr:ribonuclease HII [Bacteroidota bacterium]MDA0943021.1 ribonuclease HII [Bacteroidota bacterium]MDA1111607.1 ribonuclease HII [Bacteroidota bacterium]